MKTSRRQDPTLPQLGPDTIDDVISAMTAEEKIKLVVGAGWGSLLGIGLLSDEPMRVPGAAGMTRSIPRLGIPSIILSDGPAGVRIRPWRMFDFKRYYCTGFPVGTQLSSTWNSDVVREVGRAMGAEALEYGVDVLLAPGMNIHRNPLNGRNFEYYSEDPVLTASIASAFINGVQSNGVGTSAKHFAVNSQETNRMQNDARVDEKTLQEMYLRAFRMVVRDARPWTVMSSYNKINGTHAQSSRRLLTDILRREWGFDGLVMTDWTVLRESDVQLAAGNDLLCPGLKPQRKDLAEKLHSGALDQSVLDGCVRNILSLVVKTPTFKKYPYSSRPDLKAGAEISRRVGTEGIVLLKNDAALPFACGGDVRRVALFGVSSYDVIAGGTGSGNVNKPYVVSIPEGLADVGMEIDPALEKLYRSYLRHKSNRRPGKVMLGVSGWKEMPLDASVAARAAADNDAAVITIGRQAGEGEDRVIEDDFLLNETEISLIRDVCTSFHAQGRKVVVIINAGGVVETASWRELPDAIMLAWGPGQEAGRCIADIISGRENPSGKLPMSFPLRYEDIPSSADFPIGVSSAQVEALEKDRAKGRRTEPVRNVDFTEYNEGMNIGYRYFQTCPEKLAYPFGFGLSYTSFEYSDACARVEGDTVVLGVKVRNSGACAGREVVQAYVKAPSDAPEAGVMELKAFAKTSLLQPGESCELEMKLLAEDLAVYDSASAAWTIVPGKYCIGFGSSSENIRLRAEFSL